MQAHPQRSAVIFDVDGVLVDSYQAHFESWRLLADQRGCHKMTEAEFLATFGRTSREIIAELWPRQQLGQQWTAAQIAELDDQKEEIFRQILRARFPAMPGAAALIEALHQSGFAVAAGSSGPPDNVYLVLEQLQRRDFFDAVVTGNDVVRGKPAPEVFLTCAERLGVSPLKCAVIEDAVVGIEAANRAGMISIALVAPPRDTGMFPHADHIVSGLGELTPAVIRVWLANAMDYRKRS